MIEFIEMIKKMTIVVNIFLGFFMKAHEGHIVEDDEDIGDHLISM